MMFRRNSKRTSSSKKKTNVVQKVPMTMTIPEESPVEDVLEEEPWSDANFDRMAQLWKLTREQQEKMLELEHRLADVNHWKNDPFEVVRFLKEVNWNVPLAEDKFRKMVHWRVENQIDSAVERYGTPEPIFDYFPSVVLKGVDKDGDPIVVERPGRFDAYAFYRAFGTQGMVEYITYRREKDITRQPFNWQTQYYEPTYGRRVGQFTIIMDVDGLNRNHMRAGLLPLLNVLARITQDNYAGVAKRIIVLRAPSIFKLFWSLVKNFFDPCIRELITITTQADYLQVLDQYIDREVLPPEVCSEYGRGTYMPGFENVRLQGGMVSKELMATYGKQHKLRSVLSDVTEVTEASMSFGCDSDDDSDYQVTEGVKVVSGLLGGGSFRGEQIYLR